MWRVLDAQASVHSERLPAIRSGDHRLESTQTGASPFFVYDSEVMVFFDQLAEGEGVCPHRVHTEWQRPLSGVHSIMIEKLAQGW